MNIVLTGVTGYVGQNLVPLLERKGHNLVLLGRDVNKLSQCFPGRRVATYEDITESYAGFDLMLHMATLNNDRPHARESFFDVNVGLTERLARKAASVGIKRFVFFSSFHALDFRHASDYADSKRTAAENLKRVTGIGITVAHLPLLFGAVLPKRFAVLNRLPSKLAHALFRPFAALRPTLNVANLVDHLEQETASLGFREIILADEMQHNGYYVFFKTLMDFCVGLGVAALLLIFILIPVIMIKWDSRGPAIFAQKRLGRNRQEFVCYKFRTMSAGTPQKASHEVSSSSVTRIGKWMRRWKLDELPQCINLLKGEMSLVGPRPSLTTQTELALERERLGVLQMVPGITGYSQINGIDMSDPFRLAISDHKYMKMRSVLFDLKIIIQTALGKGSGDKVRETAN